MKKLLITVVVLIALVCGGLFAVAQLAPVDRIKEEVKIAVKKQTGRDLDFADAKLMFWPNIGVTLTEATFSNAPWGTADHMVVLGAMDVQLAVMPLLKKRVEVKTFVLQSPRITLEQSKDGTNNWTFDTPEKTDTAAKTEAQSGENDLSFSFSQFKISGGHLVYIDHAAGTTETIENLDVTLDFPDLSAPAQLAGKLRYKNSDVTLKVDAEKPLELANGKQSPVTVDLATAHATAKISGVFSTGAKRAENGKLSVEVKSLSGLSAWLTGTAEGTAPFEKIALSADMDAVGKDISLEQIVLKADDVTATGSMRLNTAAARPHVRANLSLNNIALDRFIGGAEAAEAAPAKPPASGDWDDTKIDLSVLKTADADIVLDTQGFSVKGVDVGPSKLTVVLKNGILKFTSSEAALFGGRFSSALMADGAAAVPAVGFDFVMKDVEAQPVLKTFAGFEKLSGTTDASVNVTARGNSQKALVNALNGKGAVTFKNGSVTGIDIVRIAQMLQSRLENMGVGEGKTDFVELGGSFTIDKGIVSNQDFRMRGPLVQVSGGGTVDLPKKTVKYRVTPVLTASSAVEGAGGFAIPVDVTGPFSNLSIRPDYGAIIRDALQNPENIEATLKGAKEQGRAIEQNIRDIRKDPSKALEGLIGGGAGGLFGGRKAEPAPEEPAALPAE